MYIPWFSVPEAPGGTKDEMQKAEDLAHARIMLACSVPCTIGPRR